MPTPWPLLPPPLPGVACRHMDVTLFVPEHETPRSTEVARKVCATCPQVEQCRDYAVPLPQLRGVWGGTSSEQRRRLRSMRRDGVMSEPALQDLPPPLAPELATLEAELANEELPVEVTAPEPVPACVVCHRPLEAERTRKGAVTCSRETCQVEHRRDRERRSKARSNGHRQPVAVPAVAVSATEYPLDNLGGLLGELVDCARRHPSALSVKFGGVRINVRALEA